MQTDVGIGRPSRQLGERLNRKVDPLAPDQSAKEADVHSGAELWWWARCYTVDEAVSLG